MKQITWRQKMHPQTARKDKNGQCWISQKLRQERGLKKWKNIWVTTSNSPWRNFFTSREKTVWQSSSIRIFQPHKLQLVEKRETSKKHGWWTITGIFHNHKTLEIWKPLYINSHNFNYQYWDNAIQRIHSLLTHSFENHLLFPLCLCLSFSWDMTQAQ